ncbi:ABC transporter substrate-binding protein [Arvimicrobium flavum]|uniref:ABC transporter substrate-binding protein n=1 Tax=Arvimicrobium flavum TaxID=3393320 RepID=UPI00237C45E1|nr:extracellular solute-binding protein [Mesorhizobium shangrilense]
MFKQLALSVAMVVGAAVGAAVAQEAPTFDQVLAGAKEEGKLIVWGSSPNKPETYQALFDAFNKRFGLDIQAEFLPINGAKARPRIIAESAAGKVSVDIVMGESADGSMLLVQSGHIKPYPWQQVFGEKLGNIEASYFGVPELDGAALTYLDGMSGIAWNTGLIADGDVPSTWGELADPKYQGQVGMNALLLTPLDQTAYVRGTAETLELAKKLLANKPRLENGTPAVAMAVSAGTVPFGVSGYHHAMRAINNGEPVKFKFFSDIIPHSPLCLYVVEKSSNPNTARLFSAWFVTEGLAIAAEHEPIPSLRNKDSDFAKAVSDHLAETGAKVSKPDSAKGIADVMELRKELQSLMTAAQ